LKGFSITRKMEVKREHTKGSIQLLIFTKTQPILTFTGRDADKKGCQKTSHKLGGRSKLEGRGKRLRGKDLKGGPRGEREVHFWLGWGREETVSL